jgi:hypothetical protein
LTQAGTRRAIEGAGTSNDPRAAPFPAPYPERVMGTGRPARKKAQGIGGPGSLYTLEVQLIGGPVTEDFVSENPLVSRTIQIAGKQTLERLHHAIYLAFDREEEHMYEFQIGGKKPLDARATRYARSAQRLFSLEPDDSLSAERTRIGALGLSARSVFFYWFDFGDDWWHRVKVLSIEDALPKGRFPRVTHSVGESPPQYPDFDEEDDYEEEEDEEEDEDDDL